MSIHKSIRYFGTSQIPSFSSSYSSELPPNLTTQFTNISTLSSEDVDVFKPTLKLKPTERQEKKEFLLSTFTLAQLLGYVRSKQIQLKGKTTKKNLCDKILDHWDSGKKNNECFLSF